MNSVQREEELKQLAYLVADESRDLAEEVRHTDSSHLEALLGYIATEINAYFERQKEAVS